MTKERIDAALNNLSMVCEKLQADLKTHQQLQSDIYELKQLAQQHFACKEEAKCS